MQIPEIQYAQSGELQLAYTRYGVGLAIRAGLHAGEIEVRDDVDVAGVAVNLAARVQQAARDGAICCSMRLA